VVYGTVLYGAVVYNMVEQVMHITHGNVAVKQNQY